jgi:hypothetical protein
MRHRIAQAIVSYETSMAIAAPIRISDLSVRNTKISTQMNFLLLAIREKTNVMPVRKFL